MAHRATASTGQKETETAAFASLTAADIIRAPIVERKIPVDFRPLLKPHKAAGRLCLRVERLPQGAKMSAGRRNTDNSWSLASDELEGLHYLVNSNVAPEHELTVRVMNFVDGAASTLKVSQFPISASDAEPAQTGRDPFGHDPVLHSQLSEMHSLFAVRESELLELRAALQKAVNDKETELAKSRSAWEAELEKKIAEAVAQCRLQDKAESDAKETERKSKSAQQELLAEQKLARELELAKGEFEHRSETNRQKWQADTERQIKVARQEWKAEADQKLEAARQAWQAKSDEHRKTEVRDSKADTEKRIESVRQKLQAEADEHLAKERERWNADADRMLKTALQGWRAESDKRSKAENESWKADGEKRIAAEREKWHSQADEKAARERDRWSAETDQKMEAARQVWQAEADERSRLERGRWQTEAEKLVEEERQKWLARGDEKTRAEFERSRTEIESRLDAERQKWQAQSDEHARKERALWQADAEQRLEAARRTWQSQADDFVAAERARLQAEADQRIESERQRIESQRVAQSAMESAKGAVDSPVPLAAQAGDDAIQRMAEEQEKNRQLQAALVAEADKCRELEKALDALNLRCQAAESAPAAAERPAPAADNDDAYIRGLRAEIVTLRKSLANQAAELGRARASLEQTRPLHIQRGPENRPLGNLRDVFLEDEETNAQAKKKGLIRDCIVVAAIVIPLIVVYPWIAVYLPDQVRSGISFATAGLLSVEVVEPPAPHAPAKKPAPAPQVALPTAIATRVLNVHATPASKGTVLLSLQKNASVVILETQGSWTRVEVPAEAGGKPQQGWVFSAYLHDKGE